jgi:hypothetical protein
MDEWGGRAAARATRWVLIRDAGICWICHHPGADTLDHIKPRSTHPELTWDPNNWRAAHGKARPEYDCPGQYARGTYPGPRRIASTKPRKRGRTW